MAPELKGLFEDWVKDLKAKILDVAKETHDPGSMAAALSIPDGAVYELILVMVREGSIRITGVEPANIQKE